MFAVAIIVGIYSYSVLVLGLLGLIKPFPVFVLSLICLFSTIFYFRKTIKNLKIKFLFKPQLLIFTLLFLTLAAINFIGVLGPELSFDALWYHLTIPKFFIESNSVHFIPGGIFYYSVMPKLVDMLYIPGLMFGVELVPKLISLGFGIMTCVAIYKLSRKFYDGKTSLIASLIFYSSLVVSWESTTAYIDLGRTFFEILALWGIINYFETKERKWIVEGAVMLGLAVSSKLIAIGSIPIFIILIYLLHSNKRIAIKNAGLFFLITILIPLPWFVFAYLSTGNPLYPLLTDIYKTSLSVDILNPINFIKDLLTIFLKSADPISPIYLMFFPLLFLAFKNFDKRLKIILLYCGLALVVWYFTPRTGGGRFILPYLPAFSILAGGVIYYTENLKLKRYLIWLVIIVSIVTISYRALSVSKFIPVIFGQESKEEFLTKNLNFDFGDFYDTDGWFEKNIKEGDMVLLYGFHNLYYADFPFIHESYAEKDDKFNLIATQNSELPERFKNWEMIHSNPTTNVSVYQMGDMKWSY